MRALKPSLVAATATLALAGAARADDGPGGSRPVIVVANIGAASDYEFRGISQTDNRPDIYGGLDATIFSLGYAGVWVSNVDFHNGTKLEYDLYGGVRPVVGPVTVDLGVIRYGYTSEPSSARETYTELKVAPSMVVGPGTVGLAYFYSDQFFGHSGRASYYEINGSAPIGRTAFSVSAAVGRQEVVGPLDYHTWNLGLGYALNSHAALDLRYWDTDKHSFGPVFKSKVVLGAKLIFP